MSPVANGIHKEDEDIDYNDIEERYQFTSLLVLHNELNSKFQRYHVDRPEGYDHLLVVDGVPVIDQSKSEKLLSKINKDFARKGVQIKPDQMDIPWDATSGKSKGYPRVFFPPCITLI